MSAPKGHVYQPAPHLARVGVQFQNYFCLEWHEMHRYAQEVMSANLHPKRSRVGMGSFFLISFGCRAGKHGTFADLQI